MNDAKSFQVTGKLLDLVMASAAAEPTNKMATLCIVQISNHQGKIVCLKSNSSRVESLLI